MSFVRRLFFVAAFLLLLAGSNVVADSAMPSESGAAETADEKYLAPVAIVPLGEDQLAVLGSTGRQLLLVDRLTGGLLHTAELPAEGSGIVILGQTALVTTNEPAGRLLEIDLNRNRIVRSWRVGHMPSSPVISPQGNVMYLANRFENRVRSLDLATGVPAERAGDSRTGSLNARCRGPPLVRGESSSSRAPISGRRESDHVFRDLGDRHRTDGSGAHNRIAERAARDCAGLALSPRGDYVVVALTF